MSQSPIEPAEARLPVRAAAAMESAVKGRIGARLTGQGWAPRVVPYIGYGGPGWARVLARVLLASPRIDGVPADADVTEVRGWRRFLTIPSAGLQVRITLGEHTHQVSTTREGYLDVRLDSTLPPGWHEATLQVDGGPSVRAPLRIVSPATLLGLVSDIDDTVIVTMLPRPLTAFRNTFVLRERDRVPVPGMAALYAEIARAHPDPFVVYLSTGAWNLAGSLRRFLARHDFPAGPLLLTDWGPTQQALFRSGADHKRAQLERLMSDLPQLRWLLVGDNGQNDPVLYEETAKAHPERIHGVLIRELTAIQQLATHVLPRSWQAGHREDTRHVHGPDGVALRGQLEESDFFQSLRRLSATGNGDG